MRNTSILDEKELENPHFELIFKYIPEELLDQWRTVPREYYTQSDLTLTTLVKPTEPMILLRRRFQGLITDRFKAGGPRISLVEWASGVCVVPYLLVCCESSKFLAWCTVPEPTYEDRVNVMLTKSLGRLEKLLELDLYVDDPKNPDGPKVLAAGNAGIFIKAFQMLDMRARGQYTQRVEQKTMQVNVSGREAMALAPGKQSLEELDREIAALEKTVGVLDMPKGSM